MHLRPPTQKARQTARQALLGEMHREGYPPELNLFVVGVAPQGENDAPNITVSPLGFGSCLVRVCPRACVSCPPLTASTLTHPRTPIRNLAGELPDLWQPLRTGGRLPRPLAHRRQERHGAARVPAEARRVRDQSARGLLPAGRALRHRPRRAALPSW